MLVARGEAECIPHRRLERSRVGPETACAGLQVAPDEPGRICKRQPIGRRWKITVLVGVSMLLAQNAERRVRNSAQIIERHTRSVRESLRGRCQAGSRIAEARRFES